MNPLLLEVAPSDLEVLTTLQRRLAEREERTRIVMEELGTQARLLDVWSEMSSAPAGLHPPGWDDWEVARKNLSIERDRLANDVETGRRTAAVIREATSLLVSFLDLLSASFDGLPDNPREGITPTRSLSADANGTASVGGANVTSHPRSTFGTGQPRKPDSVDVSDWRTLVKATLETTGPMHYRDLYRLLRSKGVIFGGAHPAGTFLATMNRDTGFVRVGRGMYWIADRPLPDMPIASKSPRRSTRQQIPRKS